MEYTGLAQPYESQRSERVQIADHDDWIQQVRSGSLQRKIRNRDLMARQTTPQPADSPLSSNYTSPKRTPSLRCMLLVRARSCACSLQRAPPARD